MESGLIEATKAGDEAAVRESLHPVEWPQGLKERADRAMSYCAPEIMETINQALETAARWTDSEILDGVQDYHARYADLEFRYSNQPRTQWLAETGQTGQREELAGDCATRALNEATGGMNYGQIWRVRRPPTRRCRLPEDRWGVSHL